MESYWEIGVDLRGGSIMVAAVPTGIYKIRESEGKEDMLIEMEYISGSRWPFKDRKTARYFHEDRVHIRKVTEYTCGETK